MKIYGIDFTSSPSARKPLAGVECRLDGDALAFVDVCEWSDFSGLRDTLTSPGPWVAGLDFPFGQSAKFIENMRWPRQWASYARTKVKPLSRQEFRKMMDDYRRPRAKGDKEHLRATDMQFGAVSPQKLYGVPVGLMFFEGAPILLDANVTIPGLRDDGCPERVAVEAYPGAALRTLLGEKIQYKSDTKSKQTAEMSKARERILNKLSDEDAMRRYGFTVINAPAGLADDPKGDALDALLCAVQAAWAYRSDCAPTSPKYGVEGWIANPTL